MEWLNYHHLLYFWTVARTGSIAAASKELRLAPPTISNQIHALEASLGEKLLRRSGRKLVLTDTGRIAMRYADEIFSLGQEFTSTMKERPTGRPLRFSVGIVDAIPKLVAFRLLEPAMHLATPVRMICREDRLDHLLADLETREVDLVLSDTPATPGTNLRTSSHLLGDSIVFFYAAKRLVSLKKRFPVSLDGAPFLLPLENSAFRRDLNEWFHTRSLQPVIQGEFADFALLLVFAEAGFGIFAGPSVLEQQLCGLGFQRIGKAREISVRFFAISLERQIQHPAVVAVRDAAGRTFS